jgi:glucose/arabinose dehydrogenase
MTRPLASLALAMCTVGNGSEGFAQERSTSYGPRPALPSPDTTANHAGFPRVVGWPRNHTPSAPSAFRVSLFAAGLHQPRSLHVLPNGDVLVVEANNSGTPRDWAAAPWDLAARYAARMRGPSANRITILRDTTGDGEPDARAILVEHLNQPFGVVLLGGFLYVANTDALVRFPYEMGSMRIASRPEHVAELPAGGYNNHWTRNVVASRDGRKLYVSVGSATNVDLEGIDRNDPRRAAIVELDPDGRNLRVFASGLRNPVGLGWAPGRNELWTAVNERDGLGDDVPPDYVTRVQDGGFYGWPQTYFGAHRDPRHATAPTRQALKPDYATGAHTATINLVFYEGNAFPPEYRGGMFIAQHGSWNRRSLSGHRVVFLPFRDGSPAGPMRDFLSGFVADSSSGTVHGRPIGLAVMTDGSLLVSDDAAGVVWRVRYARP